MPKMSANSRLVSILIVLMIGATTWTIEYWLEQRQRDIQQETVFRAIGTMRARFETLVGQQLYTLQGLATYIGLNPELTQHEFVRFVENSLPVDSVITVIAGARNLIVNLIYPLEANKAVLGLNYRERSIQRPAALLAIEQQDIVLAGPVELVQGGLGFVARTPVFIVDEVRRDKRSLWGLVAAVIPTDTLYEKVGLLSGELGIEVAIRGRDATGPDGPIFFGAKDMFEANSNAIFAPIQIAKGQWQLAARPIGGWGAVDASTRWVVRAIGFAIGLLLLAVVWVQSRLSQQTAVAEQNFEDLFELSSDALYISDAETLQLLNTNQRGYRQLGYERDEMVGHNVAEFYSEKGAVALSQAKALLDEKGYLFFETLIAHKNGTLVPVEISSRRLTRSDGDIVISAVRDITERKLAEAALEKSRQDLISAIEAINEGFVLWDPDGNLQLYNQRYLDLAPELSGIIKIGVSFREVLTYTFDRGLVSTNFSREEWIESRLQDHLDPTGPYEFRAADGRYVKISEYVTADGSCVGIYEDITALKRATEHVHYRAYFDVLTGLPNRENFLGKLTETLAALKRSNQITALLFIDLDRFKIANDSFGHAIGDKLLREVALRLRTQVRETDFVARFAGDEFMVLLRYIDEPENAGHIADTLLKKLNVVYEIEGHDVYCSASIGIAVAPNDSFEPETILKYADLAMYQAKAVGGNAFSYFKANMTERAQRSVAIEKDLRNSIKENQCRLYYQPVFALDTNILGSTEALIRWKHPKLGFILPDQFISIAEETTFIDELGRWVIEEATRNTVNWQARESSSPIKVAVNVSSRQFWGEFDTSFVREVLLEANFPPDRLIIEITESLVMGDEERIIKVLEDLRDMGVGICIDDFGTGYSAISYLRRLPVTILKIDKSFVTDIERSLDDALLVESIVAMAKALRVKVVAEGVETDSQLSMLTDMGCDFGQGLLFGEPVSSEEFRTRFLEPNVVQLRDRHRKPNQP